jgi:hypothetical protein
LPPSAGACTRFHRNRLHRALTPSNKTDQDAVSSGNWPISAVKPSGNKSMVSNLTCS